MFKQAIRRRKLTAPSKTQSARRALSLEIQLLAAKEENPMPLSAAG